MTQAGHRTGFWRSVRELPERTPLRVKLMTAVLALVAIALVVISVASIAILRSSLLGPTDSAMRASIDRVAGSTVSGYLNGSGQSYYNGEFVDWIPAGGNVHKVILPISQGYGRGYPPGLPLRQVPTESEPAIPTDPAWINAHLNQPFTLTSANGQIKWRILMRDYPVSPTNTTGTVVFAVDVTSVYTTIDKLASIDLLVSLAVICLVGILGVALVRASLRPLTDIERTAGAIAAGDLSKRVPERDPRTEVGRLGRSLNAMLSQIESAFRSRSRSEAAARRSEEKMRQFVADASHELRTPLTAIRGFAEYYRQRGGIAAPGSDQGSGQLAPADMDRIMRRVEQESARMGILVEDMLLLARLDQQRPLEAHPVDLLTLAADAVHDARVVAPSRSIQLTVGAGSALLVIGDEVRLRQVIGNLMSNALTHTPAGTPIEVLIRSGNLNEAAAATAMARPDGEEPGSEEPASYAPEAEDIASWDAEHVPPQPAPLGPAASALSGPAAVLEVTDHGPGLAPEQAEHVFERFYRADQARTTGGTGLGLAIVAALISAHGGTVWVKSRRGEGATFCIALPLAPEVVLAEDDHEEEPDAGGATDWNGLADETGQAGQNGRTDQNGHSLSTSYADHGSGSQP
jgi:two-component system, OmpR family, sensor kinase